MNCEKTQFFSTLYNLPVAVVVLVHSLQPAHVVVGVGHQVDVDKAGLGGGTGGVAAFSRHLNELVITFHFSLAQYVLFICPSDYLLYATIGKLENN